MTGEGRQQGSISCAELRPRHLATENLELVPQHQQLDVFHMQPAAATNERTEQSPKSEIEEGEDHTVDPPSPLAEQRDDTNIGALQADAAVVVHYRSDADD